MPRVKLSCGTVAAARRHYKNGEKPCEACRQAVKAHNRIYNRARTRALRALQLRNPAKYADVLSKERVELGLPADPTRTNLDLSSLERERRRTRARDRAQTQLAQTLRSEYRALLTAALAESEKEEAATSASTASPSATPRVRQKGPSR